MIGEGHLNQSARPTGVSDYRVHAARSLSIALPIVAMLVATACGGGHVDPGFYKAVEWSDAAADERAVRPPNNVPPAIFAKPKLGEIRAEWCPFCTRAQPALDAAYGPFRGRVDLVVLDVTDETTAADAARVARMEGVTQFYEAYRGRTPTIGVFVAPGEGRRVHGNMEDPDTLTTALDYALDQFAARQRAVSSR
jgi:hypothetical protein